MTKSIKLIPNAKSQIKKIRNSILEYMKDDIVHGQNEGGSDYYLMINVAKEISLKISDVAMLYDLPLEYASLRSKFAAEIPCILGGHFALYNSDLKNYALCHGLEGGAGHFYGAPEKFTKFHSLGRIGIVDEAESESCDKAITSFFGSMEQGKTLEYGVVFDKYLHEVIFAMYSVLKSIYKEGMDKCPGNFTKREALSRPGAGRACALACEFICNGFNGMLKNIYHYNELHVLDSASYDFAGLAEDLKSR